MSDAEMMLEQLVVMRTRGFGVTINWWPDDPDAAAVAWLHGQPVASGRGPSLPEAVNDLAGAIVRVAAQ